MLSSDKRPGKDDKEPGTMASRILSFCFAVFLSVILLYLAIDILAAIWGWLLLIGIAVLATWLGSVFYRHRRDRW